MGLAETAELAVRISLKDNVSSGIRGMQKNLGGLNASLARTGKGFGQIGAGIARAGLVAGGAAATGLALAAKNAIDFQDAFAGVKKTIEASPAELDALNESLRKLSTRIPVKYTDLAAIAQEAGALGVPTKEVANFTEVVSRLSAATVGLTVDAAAEAFGKLGNVLQLHGPDYEKMGSSLVALGNAGASSEGDIIEVAKRFGAAGATAKLSAAQVLGFASAIASMGVEPEAAGSSLSRLFNNITKYIGTGNKKIKGFADVTGQSVKQFSDFFAKDASGAVQLFLKDLSKLDRFKASAKLKEAGIINVRDINAVLLLSRGYKELGRQVSLSEEAYAKNTALAEVSAKRFDTLKARLAELKNAAVLASVTLAEGFLPALDRSVQKLGEFLALDTTKSGLKGIGEDIGKAIDGIDWNAVLTGAQQFLGVLKGALSFARLLYDAFSTLPGPIKEATAGFLVLNKLSGGLVATGAGNVLSGLLSALARSGASKLPGVGSLFAQPVFVTNFPPGFGAGGPGGLPTKTGGLGLLSKVFLVGEAIGLAALVLDVRQGIADGNTKASEDLKAQTSAYLAQQPSKSDLLNSLAAVNNGISEITNNPLNVFVQGDALDNLKKIRGDIQAKLAKTPGWGAGPDVYGPPTPKPVYGPPDIRARLSGAQFAAVEGALSRGRSMGFHPKGIDAALATLARSQARMAAAVAAADASRASTAAIQFRASERLLQVTLKPPQVTVNVNVTASQVTKSIVIQNRYGEIGGSRNNGPFADRNR